MRAELLASGSDPYDASDRCCGPRRNRADPRDGKSSTGPHRQAKSI